MTIVPSWRTLGLELAGWRLPQTDYCWMPRYRCQSVVVILTCPWVLELSHMKDCAWIYWNWYQGFAVVEGWYIRFHRAIPHSVILIVLGSSSGRPQTFSSHDTREQTEPGSGSVGLAKDRGLEVTQPTKRHQKEVVQNNSELCSGGRPVSLLSRKRGSQCRGSPSMSSLRNGDGPRQQEPRKHRYGRLW